MNCNPVEMSATPFYLLSLAVLPFGDSPLHLYAYKFVTH